MKFADYDQVSLAARDVVDRPTIVSDGASVTVYRDYSDRRSPILRARLRGGVEGIIVEGQAGGNRAVAAFVAMLAAILWSALLADTLKAGRSNWLVGVVLTFCLPLTTIRYWRDPWAGDLIDFLAELLDAKAV